MVLGVPEALCCLADQVSLQFALCWNRRYHLQWEFSSSDYLLACPSRHLGGQSPIHPRWLSNRRNARNSPVLAMYSCWLTRSMLGDAAHHGERPFIAPENPTTASSAGCRRPPCAAGVMVDRTLVSLSFARKRIVAKFTNANRTTVLTWPSKSAPCTSPAIGGCSDTDMVHPCVTGPRSSDRPLTYPVPDLARVELGAEGPEGGVKWRFLDNHVGPLRSLAVSTCDAAAEGSWCVGLHDSSIAGVLRISLNADSSIGQEFTQDRFTEIQGMQAKAIYSRSSNSVVILALIVT